MKKLLISFVLLFLCFELIHAQETTVTTGGNSSGSGGSVSYSIGQVGYTIASDTNASITQGVQQPYEISIVIGIEEAEDISLAFKVYPNPTTNFVILNVKSYPIEELSIQLYDLNGRLINSQKIDGVETKISMSNLPNGLYFVKVIDQSKEIKVFKIIKNN